MAPQNDEFPMKSFVTRNRSLARRSIQGPKKGVFNLGGSQEPEPTEKKKPRPTSFMGPPGGNIDPGPRSRPMSMISTSGSINSGTNMPRNHIKLDLVLGNDVSTTSIANSSNQQSFNQNVLRNHGSSVDKKIFNSPHMMYSPEMGRGGHNSQQTINLGPEKKFNVGSRKEEANEYTVNLRAIHRQFNINKFNVGLKADLLKDIKGGKTGLLKELSKIQEACTANAKTPKMSQFKFDDDIDWDFWKSVVDHYPRKMTKVKSLKTVETVFTSDGIPNCIRPLLYLYLTNSKATTYERIYKENSVVSFFSKENDLRLKICETFNLDLRCLKSNQDLFSIGDLDKELLQKVDKDLFEVLRNFTLYYDRGGYNEIEGLLSPDSSPRITENETDESFYLPSKAIIAICDLLLRNCVKDEGVLNIKTGEAKLTKSEVFSMLIMLNENYFNFDNEINNRNWKVIKAGNAPAALTSRRSSIMLETSSIFSKMSDSKDGIFSIKNNYQSDFNKKRLIHTFNRALEDSFPEIFLHLSSKGIQSDLLLERFIFEFFHRFSENYKWYDNDNKDENKLKSENPNIEVQVNDISLNNSDIEMIKSSVNGGEVIKGELDEEENNEIFQDGYKLTNNELLRILDVVLIEGIEFLIKFLLLIIEKNYFQIFKIKNNKVLMKFLFSNSVFQFLKSEDFKFVNKKIYESELGHYENISSFSAQHAMANPFQEVKDSGKEDFLENDDSKINVKDISKGHKVRSDTKKQDKLIEISIKQPKAFGDFIVEALKFDLSIYKYEEELKLLEREKQLMEQKVKETNVGIGGQFGVHSNASDTSLNSTLTDFGDSGYVSSKSSNNLVEEMMNDELKELMEEKKQYKVKNMKLQADFNNLSLTHKSYKQEILLKNEKLNNIKNTNLQLKLFKDDLERKLNELKLKEELFHSVLRNRNIEKMNDEVKIQINHVADEIRETADASSKYKMKVASYKDKLPKEVEQKPSPKGAAGFFSGFGFGRK